MSGELQELMKQHKQEQKKISETMEAQREQIQLLNEKLNKKPKSRICSITWKESTRYEPQQYLKIPTQIVQMWYFRFMGKNELVLFMLLFCSISQ